MNPPLRVLYVDDYPLDRELVRDSLEKEHTGFIVTEAASRTEFQARLAEGAYDVVLSDFNILGFEGLQVLDAIRQRDPNVPVIIVTGTGSEEVAVEAMKRGAADYVIKSPSHIRRLPMTIQAAIEKRRMKEEHRCDEEALQMGRERYRDLVQSANSIILRMDATGRITFLNEFAQKFFGFSEEEIIGRHAVGTIVPEKESSGRDLAAMVEDLLRHPEKYANNENENIRKNGQRAWIVWTNRGIFDNKGRLIGILSIGNDITDRKRAAAEREHLEKQLRQAQKMEALGTLAGGIAHDFNNILGAIMGFTELALLDSRDPDQLQSDLRAVLNSSTRAKDLVQQILAFSRQSEQERKPIQMNLIMKEALKLLRATIPTTIEIREELSCQELISGDPTQIHQVIMNLCTNAAHAMKETGGVLDVSLTAVDLDQSALLEVNDLHRGRYLRLTVADMGHGIEPEILDKIFDPFFTTKGPREGTGLGLSVVHGIVRSHGGAIKVYSEQGQGTVFHVLLPLIEKTAAPLLASEASPIPRGTERILLVDDESTLALMGKAMLERLGYHVVTRTGSLEALEAFKSQTAEKKFDLVITDLTMPHMTGLQFAKELQRLQPGLPIILCTGFSELGMIEKATEAGIGGFIMKPVLMRELGELVRKVLDGAR